MKFSVWASGIVMLAGLSVISSRAQIVTFDAATTSVTDLGAPTTQSGFSNGTHTFENNVRTIDVLSAGGTDYTSVFGFNRVDATLKANPTDGRLYYWADGTTTLPGSTFSYSSQYKPDFESLFDTPFQINAGSDEIFLQTYDSIRVWSNMGVQILSASGLNDAGITIIERGANDSNFRVRAITSLDGSNDPATFSNWFNLTGGDPFGTGLRLDGDGSPTSIDRHVYQDTAPGVQGPFLEAGATGAQVIGAFMIRMVDFGLSINDIVYGYEIENVNNSGIDLIPGGGLNAEDPNSLLIVPEPADVVSLLIMGIALFCLTKLKAFARRG